MISLNKKYLTSIADLSEEEILNLISYAIELKKNRHHGNNNVEKQFLAGKTLALMFEKPSTRTRLSFETAMFQLGGNTIYLNSNDLQLSRGESIKDTAKTISLYVDCLVARVYSHETIVELAQNCKIPVINGLSDLYHPCQILADLMTILEYKKSFRGLTLSWIGDGNNVCNDLLIGCAKMGLNIKAAIPEGYDPPLEILKIVTQESKSKATDFTILRDPIEAVKNTDIVVTDTFVSIGKEKEDGKRKSTFVPKYQVNSKLMSYSKDDAIFMHCLPAKRGQEVTSDVIDGSKSVVWDEAENRLHVQKSLLQSFLS
ncbi:MAG: ornithine carbamoyltransferase [Nitrososphaeraceae archaeon]|nr:ornithine carbamoyltransferase [Nitrososphaeraceae archaeon]MDW0197709.1 ornithine carbamoyltransferase [Nitrososphaeraceae archaeon]MDW0221823.1 ornithine carbamoyltransferase [Nitrososphaeraceae archaeon]MDW0334350.1 ornithine carbamoyltransferase [Nitrososphaeraceae archaeon]